MRHERAHILVVSDDPGFATSLEKTLVRGGYRVQVALLSEFEQSGVDKASQNFDLFIVDLAEHVGSGVRFLQRMRNSCPTCTVLLVSALDRDEWEVLLVGRRGAAILEKPLKRDVLLQKVKALLASKKVNKLDEV